ncbi:MAG: hypothetical protein FJ189_06715, partial [Gammaproteobacteria bacterium]|nr:hypothetical protein [Gammaproteobacteria bacterium]
MNNAQAVGAALGVKEIRDNSKANSTAIPVKTENIPDELKPLRWAVWRAVPRADGKVGKPPCNAITGLMIGANKPATWGTFDEAVAAYSTGGWDGIGVLMEAGNGIVGLDFDRIEIIAAKGTPLRTLLKRAQEAGIYLEKSPGGKGARGFVLGELPGNKGRRKGGIELYNDARFLTVTGQGKGKVIDGQGLVDELLTIIGGEAAPAPQSVIAPRKADLALVDSLSAWAVENHPRLWEGHWAAPRHEMESGPEYPSQSEADFALVGHLAREAVKRGITATEVLAVSTLATFERS